MSDFHQNSRVTTISSLPTGMPTTINPSAKTTCIIPCLIDEFQNTAITNILNVLESLPSIVDVIVILDRATEAQYEQLKSTMPRKVSLIWKDATHVTAFCEQCGVEPIQGKGFNLWLGLGIALNKGHSTHFITHDGDILNYDKAFISNLLTPLTHPLLSLHFVKGYYPRVDKKLFGRVTRLLMNPLLIALKKGAGYSPFLEFLSSFRYILSGESGWTESLAWDLEIEAQWGVELSLLSSAYAHVPAFCAQAQLCDRYSHKHRNLKSSNAAQGLDQMAHKVSSALMYYCSKHNVVIPEDLSCAYAEMGNQLLRSYQSIAHCNGLTYNLEEEQEAINIFTTLLAKNRKESPTTLPCWKKVFQHYPRCKEYLSPLLHI